MAERSTIFLTTRLEEAPAIVPGTPSAIRRFLRLPPMNMSAHQGVPI